MCDDNFEHDLDNYSRFPPMTRRQLGAASIGAGVAFLLPRAADAQAVKESDVTVTTPDGDRRLLLRASGERRELRACSCGRTSSVCVRRSVRWASGWPNPVTRC